METTVPMKDPYKSVNEYTKLALHYADADDDEKELALRLECGESVPERGRRGRNHDQPVRSKGEDFWVKCMETATPNTASAGQGPCSGCGGANHGIATCGFKEMVCRGCVARKAIPSVHARIR
jgi:hypothetical protein